METLHIYGSHNANCNAIVAKLSSLICRRVTTPAYGPIITMGIFRGFIYSNAFYTFTETFTQCNALRRCFAGDPAIIVDGADDE